MINIIINLKSHSIKRAFKIFKKTLLSIKSVVLILIFNTLKKSQSQFNKNYIFT